MECVEAFLGDFSVDDLLDLSNADATCVREESSSSQREQDEQECDKAKSFSDQSTRLSLSPLEDLLSFPSDVPVSSVANSVSTPPVLLCFYSPVFDLFFSVLICHFVLFSLSRLVIWKT